MSMITQLIQVLIIRNIHPFYKTLVETFWNSSITKPNLNFFCTIHFQYYLLKLFHQLQLVLIMAYIGIYIISNYKGYKIMIIISRRVFMQYINTKYFPYGQKSIKMLSLLEVMMRK